MTVELLRESQKKSACTPGRQRCLKIFEKRFAHNDGRAVAREEAKDLSEHGRKSCCEQVREGHLYAISAKLLRVFKTMTFEHKDSVAAVSE